jgi:hypothetical protein
MLECATYLANGLHAHPDSERLRDMLKKLRTEPESQHLSPANMAVLRALYGDEPRGLSPDRLAQARALSEGYFRFYNHSLPFDREVIERAWRRCREPEKLEACRAGRAEMRERLGASPIRTARSSPAPR